MRRAVPVLLLTVAGLVPLWRFEARPASTSGTAAVAEAPAGARTVDGELISTSEGDVQVRVVYSGDEIVAVQMLKQPDSGPTRRAVPILQEETLRAQSADVDTVSGATATSEGYIASLQSVLDGRG
ncbi:FMN-binding protein [Umezawaea beigongshangensis]|uniref:FMN-binding protein n=1 Tax=Umezawaea beigongshangensis TaxID=2780383 RepID=UPI0018F162BB|nr:FMN-binding protein [Umezawaea beigongshangensis]